MMRGGLRGFWSRDATESLWGIPWMHRCCRKPLNFRKRRSSRWQSRSARQKRCWMSFPWILKRGACCMMNLPSRSQECRRSLMTCQADRLSISVMIIPSRRMKRLNLSQGLLRTSLCSSLPEIRRKGREASWDQRVSLYPVPRDRQADVRKRRESPRSSWQTDRQGCV